MGSTWYILDLHIATTDNLSTGPKMAPNLVFQHRRKQCQMSIVRRWQLASHWCLLQIMLASCSKDIRNIRPHTANQTCDGYGTTVGRFQTTSLVLILPPENFRLLILLTKPQIGKQFTRDADVKQAVTSWLQTFDNDFFYKGTQVLVPQWDNCLNVNVWESEG